MAVSKPGFDRCVASSGSGRAGILAVSHAFVQNLRRGHYEIAGDQPAGHRLRAAFEELTLAI